jgi:hypothetical protein
MTSIVQQNNIPLLKKSAFLDIHSVIANSDQLKNNNPPDGVKKPSYYQNYAISMWILLNDQPTNYTGYATEREIFNYGCGKPRITYYNNISSPDPISPSDPTEKDRFIFYFTNEDNTARFETRIPKQKWNHIVFNYTSIYADLFINGVLVHSYTFNENIPSFAASDNISIGEHNGLYGAICNVQYYKENMTLPQIVQSYHLSMNENPPINNL